MIGDGKVRSANVGCRKVWELWGSGSESNCRFNGDTFYAGDPVDGGRKESEERPQTC